MRLRAAVLVFGAIVLISGTPARAVQLEAQACQVMAILGRDLVWARDMGADREKVEAWLKEQRGQSPVFVVLLPMFAQIWETKASGTEVMLHLYRDCIARRGAYGTDA